MNTIALFSCFTKSQALADKSLLQLDQKQDHKHSTYNVGILCIWKILT